jgi:hypothetical protein
MSTEKFIDRVAAGEEPGDALDEAVVESSLSRMRQHMLDHDTGFITAFRGEVGGETVTRKQNLKRNKQLRASLQSKYNLTAVKGSYIENYGKANAKEVGENVFFVVDAKDSGSLKADLRKLGERFDQDSVLFIAKGAKDGVLIGTNREGWPGYSKTVKVGHPVFGKSGEFMTRVRGRPFVLESVVLAEYECDYPRGYFGEMGRKAFIDSDWRHDDEDE